MFYWLFVAVVLCSILIAFYIYNYFDRLGTIKKNLERIRNKWGRPVNARRNFKFIGSYLNAEDNPAKISHTIAEDLDLNNVFNFIDRTNSKPGKQYLYKRLFTPETSVEELISFDRKIEAINMPRPDLERIELEISKLNSSDAYYLSDLFTKEHDVLMVPLMRFYVRFSWLAICRAQSYLLRSFNSHNCREHCFAFRHQGQNIAIHTVVTTAYYFAWGC
jgi:hypothetical protein